MIRRLITALLASSIVMGAASAAMADVAFVGEEVHLDGAPLNQGSQAEGLLMNFRAINGAVDDYNSSTRKLWAYPGGVWSPDRNVNEFVAAMPSYAAHGLNMVTVGMQGGHPRFHCNDDGGVGQRNFSMFTAAGSLRLDAVGRLRAVILGARQAGLIVNVQFFYQNQDNRLDNNAAVLRATEEATRFLRDLGAGNVLVEIANEVTSKNYKHTALQPAQIDDRINQVHALWPAALVSASMNSDGRLGPAAVRQAVDWVSFHANSISAAQMAQVIRNAPAGKPIAVTEDKWDQATTPMNTAVAEGAGWGFYRQGCEVSGSYTGAARYRDGFQSLPINWSPASEPAKDAFFDRLDFLTGGS